ncbi:MAG: ribonuclease III [Alphaproteobacteria bacterium]|nr:ribonuclease III [Alphaproteobacteria bacterium]
MEKLQQTIGYHFKNQQLLKDTLTLAHANKAATYERLEFLGDRVLGLIIADMLLLHHKTEKEGDIAKRFTALVREETLAMLAKQIGIPASLITDTPELRDNASVLSDVMEALIAAIYKDSGFEAAQKFVQPLYADLIDKNIAPPVDPKTALQEWGHKHNILLPVYRIISQIGPAHAPLFKVGVKMGNYDEVVAEGTSKKIAEQNAADNFLKLYAKGTKNG